MTPTLILQIIMDTVIEKLMDGYKEVIDEALSEQMEATTEEQRSVLRDRFLASYKSNIEVGLATVFGKVSEVSEVMPLTEVGVEDLIRKGMLSVTLTLLNWKCNYVTPLISRGGANIHHQQEKTLS